MPAPFGRSPWHVPVVSPRAAARRRGATRTSAASAAAMLRRRRRVGVGPRPRLADRSRSTRARLVADLSTARHTARTSGRVPGQADIVASSHPDGHDTAPTRLELLPAVGPLGGDASRTGRGRARRGHARDVAAARDRDPPPPAPLPTQRGGLVPGLDRPHQRVLGVHRRGTSRPRPSPTRADWSSAPASADRRRTPSTEARVVTATQWLEVGSRSWQRRRQLGPDR